MFKKDASEHSFYFDLCEIGPSFISKEINSITYNRNKTFQSTKTNVILRKTTLREESP